MPFFEIPDFDIDLPINNMVDTAELLDITCSQNMISTNPFIRHLSKYSNASLDNFFLRVSTVVAEKIDCTKCANCCKKLEADLNDDDVKRLSTHMGCSIQSFTEQHLTANSNGRHLATRRCMFLENNLCGVYSFKPSACSRFPHLDEPNTKFRLRRIMELRSVCPIVYNTVTLLQRVTCYQPVTTLAT